MDDVFGSSAQNLKNTRTLIIMAIFSILTVSTIMFWGYFAVDLSFLLWFDFKPNPGNGLN